MIFSASEVSYQRGGEANKVGGHVRPAPFLDCDAETFVTTWLPWWEQVNARLKEIGVRAQDPDTRYLLALVHELRDMRLKTAAPSGETKQKPRP